MSNNKFINRLKGRPASASVVEIKNAGTLTSFANVPKSTSGASVFHDDPRNDAVLVAKGAQNWKINGAGLVPTDDVAGDGRDFISESNVAGDGMWLNASYTFPPTGSETQPVAQVFLAHSKWVLKLCGTNLLTTSADTIEFTFVVKVGPTNIAHKAIKVHKQANFFCKKFVVDFSESAKQYISAYGGTDLTVQLFCNDEKANATIFNGMTVLTLLERKVDAVAVASKDKVLGKVLDEGLLPSDYFNNPNFIEQIADGGLAFPVFKRVGNEMTFIGWGDTGLIAE